MGNNPMKPTIRTWHREAYKEGRVQDIPAEALEALRKEEQEKGYAVPNSKEETPEVTRRNKTL